MTDQRLNNLATLSGEEDLCSQLPLDKVVDQFANLDKNIKITLL